MKKKFVAVVALFAIVVLTGCTPKESKLSCTQTTSGVDVGFNVGFKGNTIDTMNLTYDMDLSKYSDTQVDAIAKQDFCTRVKNSMSQFKDAFKNCKQDVSNKKLNVNADLDINKVAKTFLSKRTTPKAAKSSLESVGYKCTIE